MFTAHRVLIESCQFDSNTASAGSAGDGGAVFSKALVTNLVGSLFTINYASNSGAGIYILAHDEVLEQLYTTAHCKEGLQEKAGEA